MEVECRWIPGYLRRCCRPFQVHVNPKLTYLVRSSCSKHSISFQGSCRIHRMSTPAISLPRLAWPLQIWHWVNLEWLIIKTPKISAYRRIQWPPCPDHIRPACASLHLTINTSRTEHQRHWCETIYHIRPIPPVQTAPIQCQHRAMVLLEDRSTKWHLHKTFPSRRQSQCVSLYPPHRIH